MTVINLRQARKTRERSAKRAKGDENAAKFGQTKAEKERVKAERARETRLFDGHKREPSDD